MFEYTITFRLDDSPEPDFTSLADGAWRRATAARLRLRIVSFAWHELDLSQPDALERLAAVIGAVERGEVFVGALNVSQRLTDGASDAASHYLLDASAPDGDGYVVLDGDYPTVAADRVPERHRMFEGLFVSEAVQRVLREVSPSEDMLWLEDRGRYAARPWHLVMPRPCAGRGVAHEWLSSEARDEAWVVERSTAQLEKRTLRPDWARFGAPPEPLARPVIQRKRPGRRRVGPRNPAEPVVDTQRFERDMLGSLVQRVEPARLLALGSPRR